MMFDKGDEVRWKFQRIDFTGTVQEPGDTTGAVLVKIDGSPQAGWIHGDKLTKEHA
jgi:hypothetical protein